METAPHTVVCVVGARPNFMKMAPLLRAFQSRDTMRTLLVHTGQHYGADMSDSFFAELGIRRPEINLEVGSASHAVQTADIMKRFEDVLDRSGIGTPGAAAVLVVGDVNSTIACALVAVKKGLPVIHVEAGLRSFDRTMPEEINRVLTDQISDLLFTTEKAARENLVREGIDPARVVFAGNVMIDTLRHQLDHAIPAAETLAEARAQVATADLSAGYALLTLHRPANVDDPVVLGSLLDAIAVIARRLPVVFPAHPRTAKAIQAAGFEARLGEAPVLMLEPVSYLRMLGLLREAKLVLTDSGGLQEESTALGIPCLTLRDSTERPITVTEGTNTVVGTRPEAVLAAFEAFRAGQGKAGRIPEYWDGQAAERIVATLDAWLQGRTTERTDAVGAGR